MINIEFKSILELLKAFPNEQTCIDHLEQLRWNGNVVSPFDIDSKVYDCKGNRYKCKNTGKYFNVRTNTLFDNTKVELQKWFLAIYLVTSHKKGISSLQLAKDIDVTQKTAWFMLHRIRKCFGIEDTNNDGGMGGEVECDETFVGGHMKNMSNSKKAKMRDQYGKVTGGAHKKPVLGILQRNGQLQCMVIEKAIGSEIKPILYNKIDKSATVITDGFGGYHGIANHFAGHIIVDHSKSQYVNGTFHTNSIEGFWSLFKRSIVGIYHYVSPKHLQQYVNESTFRYNTRTSTESGRFNYMLMNTEHRLTYKQLINA